MIRSIRHRGLKRLHEDGPRGVFAQHIGKLRDILARLDAARVVADMDMPGFRLHQLKGEYKGFWAVTVRANWRVIFALTTATLLTSITWTTTERRLNNAMKNPPHPGGFVLRQCIEPFGLEHNERRCCPRGDAHHAIGTGEREARHLSRNGREALQGFRWQRRKLACAAGAVRSCPRSADRMKLKRLELA